MIHRFGKNWEGGTSMIAVCYLASGCGGQTLKSVMPASWFSCLCAVPSPWVQVRPVTCFYPTEYGECSEMLLLWLFILWYIKPCLSWLELERLSFTDFEDVSSHIMKQSMKGAPMQRKGGVAFRSWELLPADNWPENRDLSPTTTRWALPTTGRSWK